MTPHSFAPSPARHTPAFPSPVARFAAFWAQILAFARLAGHADGYDDAPADRAALPDAAVTDPAALLRLHLVRAHLRRLDLVDEELAVAEGAWVAPALRRCGELRDALRAWERACLEGRFRAVTTLPDVHDLGASADALVARIAREEAGGARHD